MRNILCFGDVVLCVWGFLWLEYCVITFFRSRRNPGSRMRLFGVTSGADACRPFPDGWVSELMPGGSVGNVGVGDVGQTGLGPKRAPGQSGVVRDGEVYGETVTYPTN